MKRSFSLSHSFPLDIKNTMIFETRFSPSVINISIALLLLFYCQGNQGPAKLGKLQNEQQQKCAETSRWRLTCLGSSDGHANPREGMEEALVLTAESNISFSLQNRGLENVTVWQVSFTADMIYFMEIACLQVKNQQESKMEEVLKQVCNAEHRCACKPFRITSPVFQQCCSTAWNVSRV